MPSPLRRAPCVLSSFAPLRPRVPTGPIVNSDHTALPSASISRRLAALSYEGLLLSAVLLLLGFLFAPAITPAAAPALRVPDPTGRVFMFCGAFMAGALYFAWTWSNGRRTLPMKTWHIRLVMRDGTPVTAKAALLRYAAAWIGPAVALITFVALKPTGFGRQALWLLAVGYVWGFIDPERRFLHDRIAGTRIVNSRH